MKRKRLSILGSTGSIGVNTLQVVERFPDRFEVLGLAAGYNRALLEAQIKRFRPEVVSLATEDGARELSRRLRINHLEILSGQEGLIRVSTIDVDMVVSALVGAIGLIPTLSAIRTGKDVALANKEVLVLAGGIIKKEAEEKGVKVIPIDSEHSAIFQCLLGQRIEDVKGLILTASGGPFRDLPAFQLKDVTPEEALCHPRWRMGPKITIDSATLMNKGLEVIEAHWLFGIDIDNIHVLIHPQSLIHSIVEFKDGSMMAQISLPDMMIPISYALSYPERLDMGTPSVNLVSFGSLTFKEPDLERFPCLPLAYEALRQGGTMPAVLSAANEVAVSAFLKKEIEFMDIPVIIKEIMETHKFEIRDKPLLEEILIADQWSRDEALRKIQNLKTPFTNANGGLGRRIE